MPYERTARRTPAERALLDAPAATLTSAETALAEAERYLDAARLLDLPGAVLYSAAATLRPGPVYLLGLNPGGSGDATLRDSLAAARTGRNAYVDERWTERGREVEEGRARLQRRVAKLCDAMGIDVRAVPASNLVFTRSPRLAQHADPVADAKRCLPVHGIFLAAIRPRFLMTFGALDLIRQVSDVSVEESRDACHAGWRAYRGTISMGGHPMRFGNVPHLSVWASDHRADVVDWAIEGLSGG